MAILDLIALIIIVGKFYGNIFKSGFLKKRL
jgi:hypothetical protein